MLSTVEKGQRKWQELSVNCEKKIELCIISKWSHELSHAWEWCGQICFKKDEDRIYDTAKETQKYRTVFWTLWGKVRLGRFEQVALKHVYYHMWNISPVQVWCMGQGAQGWCTGMTQRDGMGREVGGRVQDGEHMYTWGWFVSMYGKTTTLL